MSHEAMHESLSRMRPLALIGCLLFSCGTVPAPPGPCSPATCPSGCCDADGTCETRFSHCGKPGTQCVRCNLQSFCVGDRTTGEARCFQNQCGCSSGCCDEGLGPDGGSGSFQCLAGTSDTACGSNGSVCRRCTGTCVNGTCQ